MSNLQLTELFPHFDNLHKLHGDSSVTAIYGAGCTTSPDLVLVFMNPTARNISAQPSWQGIHAPWLGTKLVWKMLHTAGKFSDGLFRQTQQKKPVDWDIPFAEQVYTEVQRNHVYITNLAKCTQIDARPLSNAVFRNYLDLFWQEMATISPKIIITFGTQVSYHVLGKAVSLQQDADKPQIVERHGKQFTVIPTYYPVGQGTRNVPKVISLLSTL